LADKLPPWMKKLFELEAEAVPAMKKTEGVRR
jgi:hypothetical protein